MADNATFLGDDSDAFADDEAPSSDGMEERDDISLVSTVSSVRTNLFFFLSIVSYLPFSRWERTTTICRSQRTTTSTPSGQGGMALDQVAR